MYYLEPIQDVMKRTYLINYITAETTLEEISNLYLYKLISIKPLADSIEQLAILIRRLKE